MYLTIILIMVKWFIDYLNSTHKNNNQSMSAFSRKSSLISALRWLDYIF